MVINKDLLTAAASGRQKYMAYLEKQKKDKEQSVKSTKRKAIQKEICVLETKTKKVE